MDTGLSFDKASLKRIFGDFVNIESKAVKNNDESGFGTILAKQLVELMGGQLTAESPSGLLGQMGTKVTFTISSYSYDRSLKDLSFEEIRSYNIINTLVITGTQGRDDEILGVLHKLGLNVSVTTFMKTTVNQIVANMNFPDRKFNLVIIFDDEQFDGFEAATAIWENKLSSKFIIIMISSNDKKGNYLKCITNGIDHYLVKPFDVNELINLVKVSFPFIEDPSATVDIGKVRTDLKYFHCRRQ